MDTSTARADPRAEVDTLYRQHAARLWRSLLLYTGRPEVASDAVAEAFAQAIRRWDDIREPLAWVWRAAFRIAAGDMKVERETLQLTDEGSYDVDEPLEDLLRGLDKLTRNQRASVVLHYYTGYSYAEIAEILGSTTSAVGVHVYRAKKKLRPMLEERDE